jgi:hypothetical protein
MGLYHFIILQPLCTPLSIAMRAGPLATPLEVHKHHALCVHRNVVLVAGRFFSGGNFTP